MVIELDDLIDTLKPDPVSIRIGGSSFDINDLSVGQVLKLGTLSATANDTPETTKEFLKFLGGLFKGKTPPQLAALQKSLDQGDKEVLGERQRKIQEVALIASAITAACEEVASSKKLEAAAKEVRSRLSSSTHSDS